MKTNLFKQANEVVFERFTASLVVSIVLAVVVMSQQFYIQSRSEIVIERPMFSHDREMKYVRGEMTKSVAMVWAFNAVLLYGNINQNSVGLMDAVAFSFVDSKLAEDLKFAHENQLRYMKEQDVTIAFIPDGEIKYDEETEWVTITGRRVISPIDPESEIEVIEQNYMYRVKMAMTNFRPWVTKWKEGVIDA